MMLSNFHYQDVLLIWAILSVGAHYDEVWGDFQVTSPHNTLTNTSDYKGLECPLRFSDLIR